MDGFKLFYVGWKSATSPAAASYLCERPVPGNYKKPDAIAKYKVESKQKQLEEAALTAVAGMLTEVCIVDDIGATVLHVKCDAADAANAPVAQNVMAFLEQEFPGAGLDGGAYQMYGFNIKSMLRMAGLECLGFSARNNNCLRIIPANWASPQGVHDPYEKILGSDDRKDIDMYALGSFLEEEFDPKLVLTNTQYQAGVCRRLVEKAQLCALLELAHAEPPKLNIGALV